MTEYYYETRTVPNVDPKKEPYKIEYWTRTTGCVSDMLIHQEPGGWQRAEVVPNAPIPSHHKKLATRITEVDFLKAERKYLDQRERAMAWSLKGRKETQQ